MMIGKSDQTYSDRAMTIVAFISIGLVLLAGCGLVGFAISTIGRALISQAR
jgi:hypothetical protein